MEQTYYISYAYQPEIQEISFFISGGSSYTISYILLKVSKCKPSIPELTKCIAESRKVGLLQVIVLGIHELTEDESIAMNEMMNATNKI